MLRCEYFLLGGTSSAGGYVILEPREKGILSLACRGLGAKSSFGVLILRRGSDVDRGPEKALHQSSRR